MSGPTLISTTRINPHRYLSNSSSNVQIKPNNTETVEELENKVKKLEGKINFYHCFSKLFFGSDTKQQWDNIFSNTVALSQYITSAKTVSENIKNANEDISSQILELENLIQKTKGIKSSGPGGLPPFADKAVGYMVIAVGALFLLHALPSIIVFMPAVMSLAFLQLGIELVGGLFMIGCGSDLSIALAGQSAKYQLTQIRNEFFKVSTVLLQMKKDEQVVTRLSIPPTATAIAIDKKKDQTVMQLKLLSKALGIENHENLSQLLLDFKIEKFDKEQAVMELLEISAAIEKYQAAMELSKILTAAAIDKKEDQAVTQSLPLFTATAIGKKKNQTTTQLSALSEPIRISPRRGTEQIYGADEIIGKMVGRDLPYYKDGLTKTPQKDNAQIENQPALQGQILFEKPNLPKKQLSELSRLLLQAG